MSIVKTLQIDSTSSDATEQLARKLGSKLRGGEIIELLSDLGGGKTTFVRGLAEGLGSVDRVTSPTFTISKIYRADKLELHHFDFYRLQDAGLMEHELHDLIGDPNVVVVIEWGEVVAHILPKDRLTVNITKTAEQGRQLIFAYPTAMAYLLEDQ